ncbi:Acetyl-coenzyme A synthetase 2-like, mitochondrial [Aphelenchoides fujianensis]|nr:Acetyl-coenzyme A synthetase 2-like, mitochondrial [Aphelenchoides fujianensis]
MSDRKTKFTLDESVEVFAPPEALRAGAHVKDLPGYHALYDRSTRDADEFWLEAARELFFAESSTRGLEWNFDVRKGPVFTRFMAGSKTNISYNCLERAVANGLGQKIAYKWVGNEPGDEQTITYQQLLDQVAVFSTVLRSKGVCKGDVVAIYLPMILELPVAMLACARIGAPHSVIFAGFSAESLAQRVQQADARVLITADAFCRGPKLIHLKALADRALAICEQAGHSVRTQIVVEHAARVRLPAGVSPPAVQWNAVDVKWAEEMEKFAGVETPVEWMDAEDQLFVLYTSGSTGVPKGIVHTTAGYMVYAYTTCKLTFDAQKDDVFWCTADCGWITGHSYVVYGPLLNGLTSVFFEGIPTYPTAARTWQMVEEHKVTKLYTSPTAVRCLMGFSQEMVTAHDRSSLKVVGTVGEPINPKAWLWLHEVVGEGRAAIVDTYWQTETGGHVITALPAATPTKPGSATLPFPGVRPVLVDHDGAIVEGPGEGNLCFAAPWPGISRTVLGDHERFEKTYFRSFPGLYFTGDGARRDEDGYFWVTGRVDDLMNVSGHLLSTAEIESALAAHPDVVEAAVVAAEHEIKGHFPYAFVDKQLTDSLVHQLKLLVREKIGPIAVPDETRSGKVTRRILRKIAEGDKAADLGDTSTLIDSAVIEELWIARVPARNG